MSFKTVTIDSILKIKCFAIIIYGPHPTVL